MSITYASLCDGIGAVHVAWNPMSWRCAWTCEIEPFACAVVEHHWRLPNLGDMTLITEEMLNGRGAVDLVVGGTPCQSFSVAGLRKGLADPRGNLALVFLGIVDRLRPRWVLWENVPGVLSSSGGRDFGSFVGALGKLGYGFAWRVLDAQFFGVPQRRRRVFVVGHLGDWQPAVAILFEPSCLRGNPPARRKTRAPVARALTGSTGGCSAKEQQHTFIGRDGKPLNALCMAHGQASAEIVENGAPTLSCNHEAPIVVGTLCSHSKEHGHGMTTLQAAQAGQIVTHPLTARHDSSPDGTGRGVPLVVGPLCAQHAHMPQQGAFSGHIVPHPLAFDCKKDGAGGEVSPTLRSMNHSPGNANGGGQIAVAYPLDLRNATRDADKRDAVNRQGVGLGGQDDPAPPCTTGPVPGVAVAFQTRVARNDRGQPKPVVDCLTGSACGGHADTKPHVAYLDGHGYAVRRLTPRECERLQGFPDDYTLIQVRGKPAADGPRYRALGNSMAVPVMAWIGRRIRLVDELLRKDRK